VYAGRGPRSQENVVPLTSSTLLDFVVLRRRAAILAFSVSLSVPALGQSNSQVASEETAFLQGLPELMRPWKGDWEEMRKRGLLRALVVYSKTFYFVDQGAQRGATYEALKAFETDINKKLGTKALKFNIVFIPVSRDELIPGLLSGRGDVAAAGLTITADREALVDFSDPLYTGVSEIVVTGPRGPKITRLDELSGKAIHVRKSSSYWEHLQALNQRFVQEGRKPVKLVPASEELEDEDLLEMVNAGLLPVVVVDRFKARSWQPIFTKISFDPEIALATGGEIGWMMRKGSPQLKALVNDFVRTHKQGTEFGNLLIQRYEKNARHLSEATSSAELQKYQQTVDFFKKYAAKYDVDHLLMMAQGYQESRLNQHAKSAVGAVGIMQVMPATGEQMRVGDIHDVEPNIHAGVKYLRYLEDTYFGDAPMEPVVKALFAFASYNAGPGRIQELRREAQRRGLNPNLWFRNVEYVAADKIGQETVTYVANIFKYYIAYQLIVDEARERETALKQMETTP
jgi:membrane-bound lytic murein transglycosylase MltF